MRTIPLVDLNAQYQTIKPQVDKAIKKILKSTNFVLGEEVEIFEEKFAKFTGSKFAIGVGSGLSALELGTYLHQALDMTMGAGGIHAS